MQTINSINSKPRFNKIILSICGFILILRLLLQNIFPEDYIYTQERLCDLAIASMILMTSLAVLIRKIIRRESFEHTPFDWPFLLMIGAMSLSLFHTSDLSASLNYYIYFISSIFLFFLIIQITKDMTELKELWAYLHLCIFIVILFALWELLVLPNGSDVKYSIFLPDGSIKRIGSIFELPILLAGFLILCIPLTWSTFLLASKPWQKKLALTSLLLSLIVFLLTFSFLCTVSFFLTSLLLLPVLTKNYIKKPTLKFSYLTLTLIVIAFVVIVFNLRQHNLSISARWEYLKTAKLLIEHSPWFGWGLNTFNTVNRQFVNYDLGFSSYVHNSYLQFWVETGILGFIASIWLVLCFVKTSLHSIVKERSPEQRIVLLALIWSLTAYFLDNLTNITMIRPVSLLFGWVVLAGFCIIIRPEEHAVKTHSISPKNQWLHCSVAAYIVFLLILTLRISLGLMKYNDGMLFFNANQMPKALEAFKKASAYDPSEFRYPSAVGSVYIRYYFMTHDLKQIDNAEGTFLKAAHLSPYTHKTFFILSSLAKEKGDFKKSDFYLNQAKHLSPLAYREEQKE